MIDLYFWPTPNGFKITIFCEEAGVPYRLIPVNIGAGDQFKKDFLLISPNNRMPAIVDPDGPDGKPISVFESGAILIYLAEKVGRFLPAEGAARYDVLQWLMWQMGGWGPMLGQNHHFRMYAPEKLPYAVDRYTNEAKRLYNVLDSTLADHEFMTEHYSIADMATFPWALSYKRQGIDMEDFPNVRRWFDMMKERPAVHKAIEVGKEMRRDLAKGMTEETRSVLFGTEQFKPRDR